MYLSLYKISIKYLVFWQKNAIYILKTRHLIDILDIDKSFLFRCPPLSRALFLFSSKMSMRYLIFYVQISHFNLLSCTHDILHKFMCCFHVSKDRSLTAWGSWRGSHLALPTKFDSSTIFHLSLIELHRCKYHFNVWYTSKKVPSFPSKIRSISSWFMLARWSNKEVKCLEANYQSE